MLHTGPEPKKKKAKKQQQQPADHKEDAADKPAKKKAVKKKQQQSDDPSAEKKTSKKKHKVAADADDEYIQPAADNEKPERQKKFRDGKNMDEEAARLISSLSSESLFLLNLSSASSQSLSSSQYLIPSVCLLLTFLVVFLSLCSLSLLPWCLSLCSLSSLLLL